MPTLKLRSDKDEILLDSQSRNGDGWEAMSGTTGLGLPPVQAQWTDAAGNGARLRSVRVLPRDIDIKLNALGLSRAELRAHVDRLSIMVADPCTLVWVEDDGEEWFCDVVRTGGGGYVYGVDTNGEKELDGFVITFRAGDPFWTSIEASSEKVDGTTGGGVFLGNMVALPVSPSQAIGKMTTENEGTTDAYPVWTVVGPGNTLDIRLPSGVGLTWNGSLAAGETLVIDTKAGTVKTPAGVSRYAQLGPAPKFWAIPPGITVATVSLLDTTSASSITCSWRRRKWMVI